MSTRKAHRGYEQFISEPTADDVDLDAKMIRSTTLPANFYGELPVKFVMEPKVPAKLNFVEKQLKKASKVHPLFSLFERRNPKKKATAKPEFSRYMQYLKEGGFGNAYSANQVIYWLSLAAGIEEVNRSINQKVVILLVCGVSKL